MIVQRRLVLLTSIMIGCNIVQTSAHYNSLIELSPAGRLPLGLTYRDSPSGLGTKVSLGRLGLAQQQQQRPSDESYGQQFGKG